MNYKEGYDWGKQSLETAGVSEAELDARLLWKRYAGQTEIPCLYMATGCCPKRKKQIQGLDSETCAAYPFAASYR